MTRATPETVRLIVGSAAWVGSAEIQKNEVLISESACRVSMRGGAADERMRFEWESYYCCWRGCGLGSC